MSAKHIQQEESSGQTPGPHDWLIHCDQCQGILTVPSTSAGLPIPCEGCGDFLIIPKERVATGAVIGDYILRETLGRGGHGAVFKAYQRSLDRPCAVKVLHPHYANQDGRHDELLREARLAARLNHPHIVQCYAVGDADGLVYYAMEFVAGRTLKDLLVSRSKIMPARALDILRQMVLALEYAWREQRLVHRDMKPDNIMIGDDGNAKLTDFGLARPVHELSLNSGDVISGTPQYMCPEQIMGEPMDYRGDMYSLGLILYQCVTGKAPFTGSTFQAVLTKQLDEYPPYPHVVQPDVPQPLSEMIMKMIAKSPDDRYADYDDLIAKFDICRGLCPDLGSSTVISRSDLQASQQMSLRAVESSAPSLRRSSRPLRMVSGSDSEISAPVAIDRNRTQPLPRPESEAADESAQVTQAQSDAHDDGEPAAAQSGGLKLALAVGVGVLVLAVVAIVGVGFSHRDSASPSTAPVVTATTPDVPVAVAPVAPLVEPVPVPVSRPRLLALMPNPVGYDPGNEWVELRVDGTDDLDLNGWSLRDAEGSTQVLTDILVTDSVLRISLVDIQLNNTGDSLLLIDAAGEIVDRMDYTAEQVAEDVALERTAD